VRVTHGEEVPQHEGVHSHVGGRPVTRSWGCEEALRREELAAQGGVAAR
jgi:hypothetical protein